MSAATFDELKEAIAGAYPALPKQLQRIARFALDKPDELALGTVAAVAEAAGVQPSAMIRFANALEYAGFSQMQQVFRERLVERSTSYRDRIEQLRKSGRPSGESRVLHQFVGDAVAELGQLDDNIRPADLHAAVMLLCRAERVHLLAQRRAFPIAAYLTYALGQLELRTHLLDGAGGMLANGLRGIAPRDVLVVTSFHSYSPEVVDAAVAAHQSGIAVLAITDSAFSPLKPAARVCFELGGASEPAFRSLVAPFCLAQALVVGVGHRLAEVAARPAPKRTRRNGTAS
jgi:DNA-binding MurR/RpiR family transcriptional regulator